MLKVSVISPEKTLFEGEVDSVVAPAYDGEVGILPQHAPMMTLLGNGELRLGVGGSAGRFHVNGGFLQVTGAAGGYDTHDYCAETQARNLFATLKALMDVIAAPGDTAPDKINLDETLIILNTDFGRTHHDWVLGTLLGGFCAADT